MLKIQVIKFKEAAYQVNLSLLVLLSFMIPLKKEWIPIAILLFSISSFFNNCGFQNFLKKLKRTWPLLLFFTVMLIGVIHSENNIIAWKNIETKFSFFLLPIVFSISNIDFWSVKTKIIKAFIEGVIIALLFGGINFLFNYLQTGESSFIYGKLTYFSHNSYLALYLDFCIVILLSNILLKKETSYFSKKVTIIILFVFTATVFILASKAGIICLIIVYFSIISYWTYRYKKILIGILTLASFTTMFFGLYSISPDFKNRIDELVYESDSNNNTINSRILSWKNSASVIKENFLFGVGTGDTQSSLDNIHLVNGNLSLFKKHLNSHNQFLQTGVAMGIVGLISLFIFFIIPFYQTWKEKDIVFAFFLLIIAINFLFESMLEKQEGVIFVSFFYLILHLNKIPIKTNLRN